MKQSAIKLGFVLAIALLSGCRYTHEKPNETPEESAQTVPPTTEIEEQSGPSPAPTIEQDSMDFPERSGKKKP